ncbi:nuclear protein MDM1 isoform X2 [Mugil cephalus]|uniref:nuclear protein MDM1 isoform X2 n=1 Tax=Mugil cephalus TaxID=48193 RepID=UPI001FB7C467|nr:nuclear protein MDM1 isoform X2 [Mugil cephalus]
MTVRFKCQSEYQKSYGVPRSRSVSPQRYAALSGLRARQTGVSREPGLQRRKRFGSAGPVRSSSPLRPPDLQQTQTPQRKAPSSDSRSRSVHRKESSPVQKPPEPPAKPASPPEPATPAGPRPAADPEPPERPEPGPAPEPGAVKPRPPLPDGQSQPGPAPEGQRQPTANKVDGRTRGQRSEYHRQFSWKKPPAPAVNSPLLTAEQVLYSSSRSVPPFKKNPVSMETEYRRSFQGLAPPTGPRLRKHLEHQSVFHAHPASRRRRAESHKKPRPKKEVPQREDARSQSSPMATPPPPQPQVQRGGSRMLTEYQSSFRSPLHRIPEGGGATDDNAAHQARELRQRAWGYRRRAWGTNFSRDHLSQLLSDHNALWEPSDATDSTADPPTPRLTLDPSPEPDAASCVEEALDLASNSSKRSSVGTRPKNNKTQTNPDPEERRTAWGEEEEEEEDTDEEEGRLPTPRLKTRPVQRTHLDLTTPAAGGAILVGKLRSADDVSPSKQRSGSGVSTATRVEEDSASRPPSKPIRRKQTTPSPEAPPPLVTPAQHGIQGTMRHADFQHNGELGLRFRELQCSGGGCGSDDDDRLSVMSWCSAASCSAASAVLERAQKRRENFWGKR